MLNFLKPNKRKFTITENIKKRVEKGKILYNKRNRIIIKTKRWNIFQV